MKRTTRPRAAAVLVVAAAGLLFALLAATGSTASSKASSPLIVNLGLPPTTLDPSTVCSLTEAGLAGSFYARLVQYGSKPGTGLLRQYDPDTTHVKPWLATSWTLSADKKTYTFHLRSGLKFPSGKPVDAAAFKYSLERSITMGQCGDSFIQETQFKPPLVKSITAPNATTLVITYSRPNPNALQDLAQPAAGVVDASVVALHGGVKAGKVNQWMAGHTAGYGPFLLDKYEPGKDIILKANPGFFQQPASKEIIVNLVTSDPTLLLQARSGQADVTLYLSKQATSSLKGNSCCTLAANDLTMTEYLNLPESTPALKNVKFREALTYAVPYQQILDKIAFGYGKLYYGEWMPGMPWFNAKYGAPRAFDLAKAKQLIKESGVKLPVSFSIYLPEGDQTSKSVATAIAGIWSQIGVNAQVKQVSPSEHINVVYTTKAAPTMYYDGPGVVAPDYLWGYDGFCGNAYNDLLVCIPKADKLMRQIPTTTDPAKRQKILDQVQALWVADSPRIPVYQDVFVAVLNKDMKAYYFDHELDMRTWSK
jgi:peptide/nickel transport system substrate-binding protein